MLAFSATSRELLDDPAVDGALVPVLAFLGGGIYGFAGYWLGGLALYLGVKGAKGEATYREARHILGYALAPLALSLVAVWPARLVAFGSDNFAAAALTKEPGSGPSTPSSSCSSSGRSRCSSSACARCTAGR